MSNILNLSIEVKKIIIIYSDRYGFGEIYLIIYMYVYVWSHLDTGVTGTLIKG